MDEEEHKKSIDLLLSGVRTKTTESFGAFCKNGAGKVFDKCLQVLSIYPSELYKQISCTVRDMDNISYFIIYLFALAYVLAFVQSFVYVFMCLFGIILS